MNLRDFLERYGVSVGLIGALALVVALLPGNSRGTASRLSSGGGSAGEALGGTGDSDISNTDPGLQSGGAGGVVAGARGGVSGSRAAGGGGGVAGGTSSVLLGQGPCRPDTRMKGVSLYMPPCLKWVGGENGGPTARGVTKDAIKVVRWVSTRDPGTEAILRGYKLSDPPEIVTRAYDALRMYSNHHYETYGREVQVVEYKSRYNSSAPDEQILKQDAIEIANSKAFAVIIGDPAAQIPKVLGQELAVKGIICICTVSLTQQFYKENPPYIFGSLPTADDYAVNIAEYIGKRLKDKNAKWAGDEFYPVQAFQTKPRKFGVVYLNGAYGVVDPEGLRSYKLLERELAKYGVPIAAKHGYLYDPGRNQNDVTALIATMKDAGVTTVIGLWDPLYPILITREATNQQYFPEWFISGTGLADTTAAGRLYDQNQWRHAFGVSPIWVTWLDVKKSAGYREFYHARPDVQPGSCGGDPCEGVLINIYRAYFQSLFQGIHLAGPKLTADTFAQGMLNYPKTGGTPLAPLVYRTRESPVEIKDFSEVFYAADQTGPDERGDVAPGTIMRPDGGRRYLPGQWPATEPTVFNKAGAATLADGSDPAHEQDGHKHTGKCLSCS